MRVLTTALLLTAATATPAMAQRRDSVALDAIVAIVNSVPITRYDLETRLVDTVGKIVQRGRPMPDSATLKALVKGFLDEMLDEEVLLAKAKEMLIDVPEIQVTAYVEQYIKTVRARYPVEAEYRAALAQAGIGSPEDYRRFVADRYRRDQTIGMLVDQLTRDKKLPMVNIPESQVQAMFDMANASGGLPARPSTVEWRQLVVAPTPSPEAKAAAKAKAESLRAEIHTQADFERVAKRESMDNGSKDLGGDLGYQHRGALPEQLDRFLFGPFALGPGELSRVIESPFGFHLIRIDRRTSPAEVKVRQILIIPKIDSADVVRGKALADSLVGVIRRGEPFDTVAKKFHDAREGPPGLMAETARDSLPDSYQQGLNGIGKDSVVAFPIPSSEGHPKFVVAKVEVVNDKGVYTYDEFKNRIRADLQRQGQMRRYIDAQKKTVHFVVYLDRAMQAIGAVAR